MPVLHIIWNKELVIAANYIGNSTFMIYNSSFIESVNQLFQNIESFRNKTMTFLLSELLNNSLECINLFKHTDSFRNESSNCFDEWSIGSFSQFI